MLEIIDSGEAEGSEKERESPIGSAFQLPVAHLKGEPLIILLRRLWILREKE